MSELKGRLVSESYGDVEAIKVGTEIDGRVIYWVHFYYYNGILVDAGCSNAFDEIAAYFERGKHKFKVETVLITHHHEDHIGAASIFGGRVYANEKSVALLRNPPKIPEYRMMTWGQPQSVEAKPLESLDAVVDSITPIETPGHSFDHTSYLIDDKLFCGDLVVGTKQMVCMREENMNEVISSLERVLKYDFSYAYGGVGVFERDDVEDYLRYLESLRERVNELQDEGKSVEEIVKLVFPDPPKRVLMMEFVSGGEWSRENMVRSLLNPDS